MATLNCLVLGDSAEHAFVVDIDPNKCVDHLKSAIKEKRPDILSNVLAIYLRLWKVDVDVFTLSKVLADGRHHIETTLDGLLLRPLQKIKDVFPTIRYNENINILIECPVAIRGKCFFIYPRRVLSF